MKRIIGFTTQKLGFVIAIALAAVVGGISTGIVMASIPDANGTIHTCYRTKGGALRVVDTATDSCSNQETPLAITQNQPAASATATAYFRISNGAVDTSALRNITNWQWHTEDPNIGGGDGYCIQTAFPVIASTPSQNLFISGVDNDNTSIVALACPTGYNVFLPQQDPTNDRYALFFQ